MKDDSSKIKISLFQHDELYCPNCGNGKDCIDRSKISPQIYITCCRKCGYTDFLRVISEKSSKEIQKEIDEKIARTFGRSDESVEEYLNRKKIEKVRQMAEGSFEKMVWDEYCNGSKKPMV